MYCCQGMNGDDVIQPREELRVLLGCQVTAAVVRRGVLGSQESMSF